MDSPILKLVVVAAEIGGRLNRESRDLLKTLSLFRAQSEPRALQNQVARVWEQRWLTLIGVSIQDAVAATLIDEGSKFLDGAPVQEPLSVDVWLDGLRSFENPYPGISRLNTSSLEASGGQGELSAANALVAPLGERSG